MWFQWAELIRVRKEQWLLKFSERTTMQIHRTHFPTSWEQCWETALLLWCDPRENLFSCHSIKNYWFRHCALGLQGSVKLMLAFLLSKILMCPVRLPEVSSAHKRTRGKCFLHLQPSGAMPLLPRTAHSPPSFSSSPMASCKPCSGFFHLSLTSRCRLATG